MRKAGEGDEPKDEEKEKIPPPPPAPVAPTPATDHNPDVPSPNTENRLLKGTISALKQQEMAMFFKLEDKVRDLDAARTKLMQLKKLSQRQESDKLLKRLRGRYTDSDGDDYGDEEGDGEAQSRSSQIVAKERKNAAILSRMLNEAKKSAEEANIKVVRTDHHNQELRFD